MTVVPAQSSFWDMGMPKRHLLSLATGMCIHDDSNKTCSVFLVPRMSNMLSVTG